jgi:hypothetical protein
MTAPGHDDRSSPPRAARGPGSGSGSGGAGDGGAAGDPGADDGGGGAAREAARTWLRRVPALLLVGLVLVALVSNALLVGPVFRPVDLALGPEVHTLIVGASHAACALDPAAFRTNSGAGEAGGLGGAAADPGTPPAAAGVAGRAVSVARHGELMVSTHAKLERLLAHNPGVRRVVLAFSPIHVGEWQDEHLLGGTPSSRGQLMDYYPLFGQRTRDELPTFQGDVLLARLKYDLGVPFDLTDELAIYGRHLMGSLEPWHYPFWGGFTPVAGTHLGDDLVARVAAKYFGEDGAPAQVSARAVEAFERTVTLARQAEVQLVLVDTPTHASFRARVPEALERAHAELLDTVERTAPDVVVLRDAARAFADEHFLDPDHLNDQGAAIYSARVAQVLAALDQGQGLEPDLEPGQVEDDR